MHTLSHTCVCVCTHVCDSVCMSVMVICFGMEDGMGWCVCMSGCLGGWGSVGVVRQWWGSGGVEGSGVEGF